MIPVAAAIQVIARTVARVAIKEATKKLTTEAIKRTGVSKLLAIKSRYAYRAYHSALTAIPRHQANRVIQVRGHFQHMASTPGFAAGLVMVQDIVVNDTMDEETAYKAVTAYLAASAVANPIARLGLMSAMNELRSPQTQRQTN